MDRTQFTTLVESTQRPLRRFLAALCCGDLPLADDLAQETYMKAYLASDTFRDPERFTAWLRRIAYNCFISHCRRERPSDPIDLVAARDSGNRADDSFRYQNLYMALDRLGHNERTAIVLFYIDGCQIKEIAEIMQSTQPAIRQMLSRGRTHLKNFLQDYE